MVDRIGFRGGREHRRDAGRGRAAHRGVRADPVRAADRAGPRGAAADRAADDQQVLRPRPGAEPQPGRVPRPAGPAGVRDLLAQPGRPARRTGTSTPTCRPSSTRSTRSSGSPAPTRRRSTGVCSGGILASHRRRATSPATGRQDRLAAFTLAVTVLDNRGPAWRPRWSTERLAAAAKAASAPPRLPRRPGAGRGVRLAAPRRPDLELLGQQLPARQASRRPSTSCSGTPTPPG